jgi:hypothetical protein
MVHITKKNYKKTVMYLILGSFEIISQTSEIELKPYFSSSFHQVDVLSFKIIRSHVKNCTSFFSTGTPSFIPSLVPELLPSFLL